MLQRQLDNLLSKTMDRKEFLVHIGYGVVMITGISALLKGLGGLSYSSKPATTASPPHNRHAVHGFGARTFGL